MRDKSYRGFPLGQLVGRYIRWCRNERGLVDGTTIRDYEYTLARMALTLPDLEPHEVTIEHLRTVVDLWADREPYQTALRAPAKAQSIAPVTGFAAADV